MINELEEQVIKLVRNTIISSIDYHNGLFSAKKTIEDILHKSEVALHQEAIDELVEWLKQSKL